MKHLTQSMDNIYAYILGQITVVAGNRKIDIDLIDRGLLLQKLLEEKKFYLIRKEEQPNATTQS